MEGVSNLRGTIIPIINLRLLFGLDHKSTDEETRTIVVNVGERTMGCTVDSVTQVMRIPTSDIQPAPELVAGEATPWIAGFAKVDTQLLIVLDINELLDPSKLDEIHRITMAHAVEPPADDSAAAPEA